MTQDPIPALLAAIRKSCSPAIWSRAVELARSQAAVGEAEEDGEIRLRVTTDGGLVCPTVTLWPEDQDWWCDCDAASDQTCVHAAAAIIALRQARKAGKSLPDSGQPTGKLSYRFRRTPAGLAFDRYIVAGEQAHKLTATLSAAALGRTGGPKVFASEQDLEVERALGPSRSGVIPKHELPQLFEALASCDDVRLDDRPVRIGPAESPVRVVVEDCAEGFRLSAIQDPRITEVFDNGAVLRGDALRELGEPGLSARELEELRAGRIVHAADVATLTSDLLPGLKKRVSVDVRTNNLPCVDRDVLPRLSIETRRDGDELVMLATIVYGDPPVARVDGERLTHLHGSLPVRRPKMERRLMRTLDADFGVAPGQRVRLRGEQGIAMAERIGRAQGTEVSVTGDGHRTFHRAGGLKPDLRVQGDDFEVSFETPDGQRADPAAVMRAWREGESLVPLLDGGFAELPASFLDRFGGMLSDLLAARAASPDRDLPPSALPDLARLCEALEVHGPPGFERLRVLVGSFEGIPEALLPSDLRGRLRGYQRLGVNWLVFLRTAGLGALLADDMGLGKTLQALCAVQGRTLVIAPTSVVHNWQAEIERFRPGLSCNLYHGPKRVLDPKADITLTTYALLRIDASKLCAEAWDTVVLDEAQAIKNPDSQVAQAAFSLPASFRVAMTGTPVENRLDELWSQFHAINRGLLGSREEFRDLVARPMARGEPGVAARLRERLHPFLLRRRKAEVAPELPPRTDMVVRCELSEQERALYESIRGATVPAVVDKLQAGGSVMAALEALLRLRQAACHPGLVPGHEADHSAKLALLVDMLDRLRDGGHKALIFSQWTSLLDRIQPHLDQGEIPFARLDGSTRDRAEVVRSFQDPGGPPVMLVSLKAGGTGLNLTAADHVFLMDPWWNPAVEDQAADRTHRIGQDRPVMVYKMVAQDTVEERIIELQDQKRRLAEAAIEGRDAASTLTRDDLLHLLS